MEAWEIRICYILKIYVEKQELYIYRERDVYKTRDTECTERKCSEILAQGQISCSGFEVGLPRFPNLTTSNRSFNMKVRYLIIGKRVVEASVQK